VESYVKFVDISMVARERAGPNPMGLQRRASLDLTQHLGTDTELAAWNLRSVHAVQVLHTRVAAAFMFVDAANGRKIVFSGDTTPSDLLVERGHDADLLIHEATFCDGFEEDARNKRHSTMGQAVDAGKRMRAKHVILSHFSTRYSRVPELPNYLLEAGNVSIAMDYMVANFETLPLLPRMLPVYREVYRPELFKLNVKTEMRNLEARESAKKMRAMLNVEG